MAVNKVEGIEERGKKYMMRGKKERRLKKGTRIDSSNEGEWKRNRVVRDLVSIKVGILMLRCNFSSQSGRQDNLYGTHPFYECVENDGQAHGVLLLNSNAIGV